MLGDSLVVQRKSSGRVVHGSGMGGPAHEQGYSQETYLHPAVRT